MSVFIAGDSTAAYKLREKRPETGWGEMIHEFFLPGTDVRNFALNGRSTKSFIAEGHLMAIEAQLRAGDILFIQFGHNDEKDDPVRHTDPWSSYQENLAQFVAVARLAGALPVLLSPVARRKFDESGKFQNSHGEYPAAMAALAQKLGVPFLDIHERSLALLDSLGPEKSTELFLHLAPGAHPNYPEGAEDNTHFKTDGARAMAKLVVDAVRDAVRDAAADPVTGSPFAPLVSILV